MTIMFDLTGKVAIVTGGNGGIGLGMARGLAKVGARVVVAARNQEKSDAAVRELRALGSDSLAIPVDVADERSVDTLVNKTMNHCGRLDILINNAGFGGFRPLDANDYDQVWDKSIAGLLTAQQQLVRAALPHLRKSDAARIVNIASTEGLGATPGDSPYVVAKTAVIGLTRALAVDLGPEGITVNCICPGPIRTALTDSIPEEHKTIFGKRRTALKRYGYPEEVAHMTFSLCLPAASYITGAVIPVDGGLTIRNA